MKIKIIVSIFLLVFFLLAFFSGLAAEESYLFIDIHEAISYIALFLMIIHFVLYSKIILAKLKTFNIKKEKNL